MIKLLAKNDKYYVFAVDYYFYTVNRSTGKYYLKNIWLHY